MSTPSRWLGNANRWKGISWRLCIASLQRRKALQGVGLLFEGSFLAGTPGDSSRETSEEVIFAALSAQLVE